MFRSGRFTTFHLLGGGSLKQYIWRGGSSQNKQMNKGGGVSKIGNFEQMYFLNVPLYSLLVFGAPLLCDTRTIGFSNADSA